MIDPKTELEAEFQEAQLDRHEAIDDGEWTLNDEIAYQFMRYDYEAKLKVYEEVHGDQ